MLYQGEAAEDAADALLILQRSAPDCAWASLTVPDCLAPPPPGAATIAPTLQFANLSALYTATSLTGNFVAHALSNNASSLLRRHLFDLAPMEIAAYNVTFT
jgi:hypothetical protein